MTKYGIMTGYSTAGIRRGRMISVGDLEPDVPGSNRSAIEQSLVLVCLPRYHEYVNCRRKITEIKLKTA